MSFSHEEWKAVGAILSGAAQIGAVLAAGWYFLVKKSRGYHAPDLSLSISCERRPSNDAAFDWLSIQLILAKGDRGALELRAAEGRIQHGNTTQLFTFWGCALAQNENQDKVCVDWNASGKAMNLIADEQTQLAKVVRVPVGEACQIDVAVLALQLGEKRGGKHSFGQWQASAVSLPATPIPGVQPTPAAARP